jgi:hypothetical protein
MRKRCLSILLLLTAAQVLSAQSAADQQRFAGTWEARFKGAVICTIKLKSGEKLTGETQGCNIQVNEAGDLTESTPPENNEPSAIVNARVDGDKLSFEITDGDDTMKCELTLTAESRAELRFVDAPVKIKPIRFERR